ncbi:hypothetical protein [Halalkalibacter nanhaiisediminis]|uniref:S1 motif domain-containing protein n=1 Tax=Halalkalibacter nanhaiisediminis TaxID=688079 RepID=A0A562QB69_9BACI|nr:hypothetical protein [Halalkalibacter nanhaiisediminis]TWI53988.1 hypothetical protein IQ10_03298 [Halalkalibacter nanhaiisediminis]
MLKYYSYFFTFVIVFFLGLFTSGHAEANSVIKGTFVDVTYQEVRISEEVTEKRLKDITIENSQGRTITLAIDKYAVLTVDTLPTTIEAFKPGMEVEAHVNFRRVKELHGKSTEHPGKIAYGDKVVSGVVNRIDPNGRFLSIQVDKKGTETYYVTGNTKVFKGTSLVDLSVLFEGDRVKLSFQEYDTNDISSIEINTQGTKVEYLYKATIERIDPIRNTLVVKDAKVFENWDWRHFHGAESTSFSYSSNTPIYVGNQKIQRDRMRFYQNNEVYFVTVSEFGKEVIKRIVIKTKNERTFYEPMRSVNLNSKLIGLQKSGAIRYHDGTILIRNGRLVDSNSLTAFGTAFVITEGAQTSQYANVVHITNDGFQSPNLTDHTIYYGRISSANSYELKLQNVLSLENNYWANVRTARLFYSNDTVAVRDSSAGVLSIVAKNELDDYIGEYGYFYVTNDTIVGAHIVGRNNPHARLVSVGRINDLIHDPTQRNDVIEMKVRNVSQWANGSWIETGAIERMNIKQTTIIREGKIISANELNINDRVYILHESRVKGRILLVN